MRLFQESASSTLSTATDSYIYSIAKLGEQIPGSIVFAAISSDDSLTFFRVSNTSITEDAIKKVAHRGISCLLSWYPRRHTIVTAGRDGFVRFWSSYLYTRNGELRTPNNEGISAIAHNLQKSLLAVGTELESEGPGDVVIYLWDLSNSSPLPHRRYTESHTDTITQLHFRPDPQSPFLLGSSTDPAILVLSSPDPKSPLLLSSSTDGLINLIDTSIVDEDDAVSTVLNNKSAVHHVGFATPQQICAVSQDEHLAFYSLEEGASAAPSVSYDLRERFGCDYAINLVRQPISGTQGLVLALGANKSETASSPNVTLYTLSSEPSTSTPPTFAPAIRLQGGHGEDVVRDVWFQDDCPFILTCGEDGLVRVWRDPNADGGAEDGENEGRKGKKGKRKRGGGEGGGRFAPY